MAEGTGYHNDIRCRVHSGCHGKFHIRWIIDIHIAVDHRHHLQIGKGSEGGHNGVFGHAVVGRVHLQHHMVVVAAVGHEHILQSLYLPADTLHQVCLYAKALTVENLSSGVEHADNGVLGQTYGLYIDNPAVGSACVVSAYLAEGAFRLSHIGQYLRLDYHLGVGNALHIHGAAFAESGRLSQQIGGNRQLIHINGCGRAGSGGSNKVGRVGAVVDSDFQRLATRFRSFVIVPQMTAHVHKYAHAVLAADHKAVNGSVAHTGIRVLGNDDAVGEIGSAVQHGVGGDGNTAQIRLVHKYSLCGSIIHQHGSHGVFSQGGHRLGKKGRQLIHRGIEYGRHIFPVPPHAGGHRVVIALHLVKHQSRTAVQSGADAGQLMYSVHLGAYMEKSAGSFHFIKAVFKIHICVSFSVQFTPCQGLNSRGVMENCISAFESTWSIWSSILSGEL